VRILRTLCVISSLAFASMDSIEVCSILFLRISRTAKNNSITIKLKTSRVSCHENINPMVRAMTKSDSDSIIKPRRALVS
jgi:hypothetical protein